MSASEGTAAAPPKVLEVVAVVEAPKRRWDDQVAL